MKAPATMDEVRVLVNDVECLHFLTNHSWERMLRVIKRQPASHLAQLLQLKPHWKDALTRKFAGQLSYGGDKDLLAIMLQLGADSNAHEPDVIPRRPIGIIETDKQTPLIYAAMASSYDCCKVLLQHGADPNVQDRRHMTALNAAAAKGSFACCELLLQHGAYLKAAVALSPLFDAASSGSVDCCKLFLRRGSDPNAQRNDGATALHLAAASGSAACCELLLQHGCDPNAQENDGATPLHVAASKAFVECCKVLVSYGADAMIRNDEAQFPLQLTQRDDDLTREFLIGHYFQWDNDLFRELCEQGKTPVLKRYLDNFRIIPHPPRQTSRVKVYYHDLYLLYGLPYSPITETPLYHVLNGSNDVPSLVDHPVFERVLNLKWAPVEVEAIGFVNINIFRQLVEALVFQVRVVLSLFWGPKETFNRKANGFARDMCICEAFWFVVLLVSTYWSFISMDAVAGRSVSIFTAVLLLVVESLDWSKRRWSYCRDTTNWINVTTYGGVLVLGVMSSMATDLPHNSIARAMCIVLLSFCGLEYLRMVPLTSLLIAITFKMIKDVIKFMVLYGVFQIGFSGSFFLLFEDEDSRYNTYSEAFVATFLMLFGDFDSDLFLRLEGVKALVANVLVLLYLVGAMVMLMNLLIAMMSTSYQEVLDSARAARSIARAETILRMESLLPQCVRVHMFDGFYLSSAVRSRVYALDEADRETPANDDFDSTDGTSLSNNSSTDTPEFSSKSSHPTSTLAKADEDRPVTHPADSAPKFVYCPPQTEALDKHHGKVATMTKANQNVVNRLRTRYIEPDRPCLDDCVLVEVVGGSESIHDDLQQIQANLEAKLEASQEELATQLHQLNQEIKKELQQQVQSLQRQQEQQLKLQELLSKQVTESVLAKLDEVRQQLLSEGGSIVASPSKRFSLKR